MNRSLLIAFGIYVLLSPISPLCANAQTSFETDAESHCGGAERNEACINGAIMSAAAHNGGTVLLKVPYRVGGPIRLMSGVRLKCTSAGSVSQLPGANVTHLIETSTYGASHATIEDCRIDGNRTNESAGTSLVLLGGKGTDNTVWHNILTAAPGQGVWITEGSGHNSVVDNEFEQITDRPIFVDGATNGVGANTIRGNRIRNYGGFGVGLTNTKDNEILENDIVGVTRVATVAIDGTAVVRQGGDSFAGILPGMHLVFRGLSGPSPFVRRVDSADALTLTEPLAPRRAMLVRIGSLEPINADAAQNNLIACNVCSGSSDAGITLHDQHGPSRGNRIFKNRCSRNGSVGIALEASGSGVVANYVENNIISDNVQAGEANAPQYDVEIRVAGRNAQGNVIGFNEVSETAKSSIREYGIALDSVGPGNSASGNSVKGLTHPEARHSGSPIQTITNGSVAASYKCPPSK